MKHAAGHFALLGVLSIAASACGNEAEAPPAVPDLEETVESLPEAAPQAMEETAADETGRAGEADGRQSEGKTSGSNPPGVSAPGPSGSKLIKADPPR